jgi:hypothetical protein
MQVDHHALVLRCLSTIGLSPEQVSGLAAGGELYGAGGEIDSLRLVELLVCVHAALEDAHKTQVDLFGEDETTILGHLQRTDTLAAFIESVVDRTHQRARLSAAEDAAASIACAGSDGGPRFQ